MSAEEETQGTVTKRRNSDNPSRYAPYCALLCWHPGKYCLEFGGMRAPNRKRVNPKHLAVATPPAGANLDAIGARARYVGSVYHKDAPSFAGQVPRPRPDASICPRHLARRQPDIQIWLRDAIRLGHCGALWEGDFPRYVWHREGPVTYEARLMSSNAGEYKGYPLEADESVRGLP
jgi:hypothetical protein